MTPRAETVVVGGGVIGLSIAWRLAERGAAVAVVDPSPGRGASWAAAGMLAPVTEVHPGEEDLLRLNLASARLYPAFVSALEDASGRAVSYRRSGTLIVARNADDLDALEHIHHLQVRLELDVERLSGRECRRFEPALSPRTRGGILVPGDHQVDNRALVEALLVACERAGVNVVRGAAVRVEATDGGARGVVLDDGTTLHGDAVVLAAGARTSEIGGLEAAGLPPIRPVKGQLIHLRGDTPLVRGNVRGLEAYLVARLDGRLVLGATVEERGSDVRTTAGAVLELLRAGYELVPGIAELEVVEATAGSRPATPDNAPAIGVTAIAGVYVAAGHYRNGVLLAPITSAAIADLVLEGATQEPVTGFSPQRFAPERLPR